MRTLIEAARDSGFTFIQAHNGRIEIRDFIAGKSVEDYERGVLSLFTDVPSLRHLVRRVCGDGTETLILWQEPDSGQVPYTAESELIQAAEKCVYDCDRISNHMIAIRFLRRVVTERHLLAVMVYFDHVPNVRHQLMRTDDLDTIIIWQQASD